MISFHSLHPVICALAVGCGLIAAATDLRSRRIPNWLTGSDAAVGLSLHLATGGWMGGASSVLGLLACGVPFMVLYLAVGMGAGDVKLIAAEASLLGVSASGRLLLYTVLVGGIMGLGVALLRGKARKTLGNVFRLVVHHSNNGLQPHPELNVLNESTLRLPYAVAIASGCMLAVLSDSGIGWAR